MIAIIDYGMGNLRSVEKAFRSLGASCSIFSSPPPRNGYRGVVLPGVGAFGEAMRNLRKSGWDTFIQKAVGEGRPFLGICLGLQLIFSRSEEGGDTPGLNLIPGQVVRIRSSVRIPHMGWNQLHLVSDTPLLSGIEEGAYVYFVHSYHALPEDRAVIVATTDYGERIAAAIARENIFGLQFHPEKSQEVGLTILRNFISITRA